MRLSLFLTILLSLSGFAAPAPNVILIFCDDLGYADTGPFQEGIRYTPHLDRMAAQGRKFSRFYVSSAVCSASRAALMTGCFHSRVGIHGALGPAATQGLEPGETTIADLLRTGGYATAIYGKWHLGRPVPFLPLQQGFDDYFGIPYSGDMWPRHPETLSKFPPLPLIQGNEILRTLDDQTSLTTEITEHAVSFIERNKERPFFLYVPHPQPHVPLHVSDRHRGKSGAGLYGDVIMELDWSVGRIMDALSRNGLDERTLVIFTSDNGPWLSYGDHAGSAGPLREGKGTSWDGGVRVPCLMRWVGVIPPGTSCSAPLSTVDLLPTFAAMAGRALPATKIDGVNILPNMKGDAPPPHQAIPIYYAANELQAIISPRWKLILPHTWRTMGKAPRATGGIPGKYRMEQTTAAELYDLEAEPGELTNLASAHPEEVQRLTALAATWRTELGDNLTKTKGTANRPAGTAAALTK